MSNIQDVLPPYPIDNTEINTKPCKDDTTWDIYLNSLFWEFDRQKRVA